MPRFKATVEYIGTGFAGWQSQSNAIGVQDVIQIALKTLLKSDIAVLAAGRTDTGVHAYGQVIHFEYDGQLDAHKFIRSINFFLKPHLVNFIDIEPADDDFHARFSAVSRSYIYKILNQPHPSLFWRERAWHVHHPLNVNHMQAGASYLIGKHDFTSFRSSQCQSHSPIKTMSSITVKEEGALIEIFITAPSFLHNQVRIITGALKTVGEGKWHPDKIKEVLEAKDRALSAQTAPAHGLYFSKVEY